MNIPDGMPTFSRGAHHNPRQGACVMEYISLLTGDKWTDRPECTHDMIAVIAQGLNDDLRVDADRQRIMAWFVPKLLRAAPLESFISDADAGATAEIELGQAGERKIERYRVHSANKREFEFHFESIARDYPILGERADAYTDFVLFQFLQLEGMLQCHASLREEYGANPELTTEAREVIDELERVDA